MKRTLFIASALLMTTIFLTACGSTGSASQNSMPSTAISVASVSTPTDSAAGDRVFTLEELATFDGKDGQPAYVAVNGVVYDVTNVPEWANGEHMNGLTAGKDLTDEITNQSPHGLAVLDDLPVVGTLA